VKSLAARLGFFFKGVSHENVAFVFYLELAQDSLYHPLWDLEGDVGRCTAAVLSNGGLSL